MTGIAGGELGGEGRSGVEWADPVVAHDSVINLVAMEERFARACECLLVLSL